MVCIDQLLLPRANITLLHLRQHYIETFESPIRFCRIWLLFLTVTVSWTYGLIVTNMMLRVYALYNRDSRVIFALVALWIMRVTLVITSWFYVIPKMPFSDQCIPQNVQPSELIAMTCVYRASPARRGTYALIAWLRHSSKEYPSIFSLLEARR